MFEKRKTSHQLNVLCLAWFERNFSIPFCIKKYCYFIDSVYTERFMGLPTVDDNILGYEDAQLLKNFEGIRDKQYFLIHGTHDDNVHYQQSMLWSKVLELNDILFRQQVM